MFARRARDMASTHPGGAREPAPPRLIGASEPMRRLASQIEALSRRHCTVLLQGESGTGKELTARLIHAHSSRRSGPFVPVDCTTLRDALFESQLFGHTRGAFTGADRATVGFFRAAEGGTLFLDEIGELAPPSQAKLLRAIQEGVIVPLGAVSGIPVNVRIIAATHRDLADLVKKGEFRQDLYYRLNVACLRLPPLRQRRDDIPQLVRAAVEELAQLYQEPARALSAAALAALCAHDWPGNVRELLNAIEHALVFSTAGTTIELDDLPEEIQKPSAPPALMDNGPQPLMTFDAAERSLIERALRVSRGNQSRAAQVLAIERHRLHRKIVYHGLTALLRARS
jgi:two-component system NtrC family response regulator